MIGDKKNLLNSKGYTYIELVLALALFGIVMLTALTTFQSVTEAQRMAVAAQDINENVKYALEIMNKEIRQAIGKNEGTECDSGLGATQQLMQTYMSDGNILSFKNKNGECVKYELSAGRIKITREKSPALPLSLDITPNEIAVLSLKFIVKDNPASQFRSKQPSVTISMEVESAYGLPGHKQKQHIQTTISSRAYR